MESRITSALAVLAPLAAPLMAQQTLEAPPPAMDVAVAYDSGVCANTTGSAQVVISFQVKLQGATWGRLFYSKIELAGDPDAGSASILRMTSLYDAEVQSIDARGASSWSNSSAYFNGDSVLVEVLAQPGSGPNRIVLERATAGLAHAGVDQGCGTDLRIPSFDGRSARLMPVGCSSWLISDCKTCFLSAGHCVAAGMVAQFNVPASQANGTLVHPPIADQFPIDAASVQFENAGIGFDWAYFGGLTNNLGETPMQHQLARWGADVAPVFNDQDVIRVTGYGSDQGSDNQTQQTDTGFWVGITPNSVVYSTFILPGNSGSPVIHEASGVALGIVTHIDCALPQTQRNYGTSWTQLNLQAALANPLGVCAGSPCNSVGAPYCPTGPLMSVISATGSASISANDLLLHANNVPTGRSGLFIYSRNKQIVSFANSYLCVGGAGFPVRRLSMLNSGAGTTLTLALDQNTLPGGDTFLAGEALWFQAWFRVSPAANQTSNGLEVTFLP